MTILAMRRENSLSEGYILDSMPEGIILLPNASDARNAEEAVHIARLARELGCENYVRLEIMCNSEYLLLDSRETIRAVLMLVDEDLIPMSCMMPNLSAVRSMADAGAATIKV